MSPTGGRDERTGAGIVDPYLALTAENVAAPPRPAADGRGAVVRVLPVPHDPPLLTAKAATAGIATVILLTGAAAAVGVGVTVRRISTRRQRVRSSDSPIALDHDASAYRPVVPVPTDRLN